MDHSCLAAHSLLLSTSFGRLLGKDLSTWLGTPSASPGFLGKAGDPAARDAEPLAFRLYHAPCALLSHGVEADPIFNYGNGQALELFGVSWAQLTTMPSRLSAPPAASAARSRLMAEVARCGFIEDYTGERIAANGQRFFIEEATIWNVIDDRGVYRGQAAAIRRTVPIDSAAPSRF